MRPIDADALTDYVTKVYEYDLFHADADDYTEGRASAERWVLEKIRELPTIDAIPMWWITEKFFDVLNKDKELSKAVWLVRKAWIEEQEAR